MIRIHPHTRVQMLCASYSLRAKFATTQAWHEICRNATLFFSTGQIVENKGFAKLAHIFATVVKPYFLARPIRYSANNLCNNNPSPNALRALYALIGGYNRY